MLFLYQSEFASRLARAEAERQTLAESLMSAERRATEEKQRAEELQQQTRTARAAADYSKQELHDYKNKASRILQVSHLVSVGETQHFRNVENYIISHPSTAEF